MKKITLLGLCFFIFCITKAQTINPIEVTGFNEDIVANGVGPMTNSTTIAADDANFCLISEDWKLNASDPPITVGLPTNGQIVSTTVTGLVYQIPPTTTPYTGNNSLRVHQSGTANAGTLTLTTPAVYSSLYFLVFSGSGAADVDVTVNFSDSTSETFSNNIVPDWFLTGLPVEIQGFGRGDLSNNNVENPANNPKLFRLQVDLSAANQSKIINSITFTRNNPVSDTAVFNLIAVSGFNISCPTPSAFVASNILSNSVELAWTENGSAIEWSIEYGTTGFTPGTGTGTAVNDNDGIAGETITGLSFLTEYDVYVKSLCGGGDDSPWVGPLSFKTKAECIVQGSVTTYPFTEDFENSSPTLGCWTQIKEVGDQEWIFATGSTGGIIVNAHSGIQNARFVSMNDVNSPITKLVSPMFDLTGLPNPQLTFFYGQEKYVSDQNELKVYYRTSDIDPWVEIQHYTGDVNVWTQTTISLPNPSATYQIAFEGINNFGHANVIDDVVVDEGLSISSEQFEDFEFYPNPVSRQLSLKATNKIEQVVVYDLLGREVMKTKPNDLILVLDLGDLQTGTYLMKVTIDSSVSVFRVIKE